MNCELCATVGGRMLWKDDRCRVVLIEEPEYPGYCRVIWNTHVAEMTDLATADRAHCLHVVFEVEAMLRELMSPHKVNLASLGNFTPHVHWHVIPRFRDDPHFPQAIWGTRQREVSLQTTALEDMRDRAAQRLALRLNI